MNAEYLKETPLRICQRSAACAMALWAHLWHELPAMKKLISLETVDFLEQYLKIFVLQKAPSSFLAEARVQQLHLQMILSEWLPL